jgi:nucleotidyltransferase/DNA polymerase involved in DNA repair
MRLLHLHWPHLLLQLARSRASHGGMPIGSPSDWSREAPIILGGQPWSDGIVLDATHAARMLGVRRGLALGTAHRLAPEARFLDPDPVADADTLEAALERIDTFSPAVSATADPAARGFGHVEVLLDGLERLWGPEPVLAGRVTGALASILPGPPRAGIAGTRFAAVVASMAGSPGAPTIVAPGDEADFLAPLPSALLTGEPEIRARLGRLGLARIGAVARIPRSALLARFGPEGALIHARARGEEIEPFAPRRAPERAALALAIEPAVDTVEAIRFVLHRLAAALADQLAARGAAAGRVRMHCRLDRSFAPRDTPPELVVEQRFPEPTSDPEAIERLLVARLERVVPPAPVSRLELELLEVGPAVGQQLSLFTPQAARGGRLGWQLARLALAYGEDRVQRVVIVDPEAPLAEARVRWQPIAIDGEAGS